MERAVAFKPLAGLCLLPPGTLAPVRRLFCPALLQPPLTDSLPFLSPTENKANKATDMTCPWKSLFRVRSYRGNLKEEKDINNNVGRAPRAVLRYTVSPLPEAVSSGLCCLSLLPAS